MAAYRGGRAATILSCVALALYVVGLGALIPTDHILVLQNETIFGKTTPSSYRRIATEVLDSIWRHVELSPAFALGLWLLPMIVATRVPLHAVTPVLRFLAIVFGSIMVFSLLLSPLERANATHMLRHTKEMGYMYIDSIVLMVCALWLRPDRPDLLLLGPGAAVCGSSTRENGSFDTEASSSLTRKRTPIVVALAFAMIGLAGILLAIPIAHTLIDSTTNALYIQGYVTDSVFGTFWSYSLMICWVQVFHIIARKAGLALRQRNGSILPKVIHVSYMLLATALTQIWVSSAFAFTIVYSAFEPIHVGM